MTSVPCFRIWDHFSPFRVLGFGVIFRRSMFKDLGSFSAVPRFRIWGHFPPFHHSTVLPFYRSTVLPFHRSTVPPFYRSTVPPFHRSTVPQFHSSTVPQFHSSTIPAFLVTSGNLIWIGLLSNNEQTTVLSCY